MAAKSRQPGGNLCLICALVIPALFAIGPALVVRPDRSDRTGSDGALRVASAPGLALLSVRGGALQLERTRRDAPLLAAPEHRAPAAPERVGCQLAFRDAASDESLAGAVRILSGAARSAPVRSAGERAQLWLAPSTSAVLRVTARGYQPREIELATPATGSLRSEVALERAPGVRGQIQCDEIALSGLCIGLAPLGQPLASCRQLPQATTDAEGRFYLPHSTAGGYRLVARCAAGQLLPGPGVVLGNEKSPAIVRWRLPLRALQLRLRDAEARPHRGARVRFAEGGSPEWILANPRTDAQGTLWLLSTREAGTTPLLEAALTRGSRHLATPDCAAPAWTWLIH